MKLKAVELHINTEKMSVLWICVQIRIQICIHFNRL